MHIDDHKQLQQVINKIDDPEIVKEVKIIQTEKDVFVKQVFEAFTSILGKVEEENEFIQILRQSLIDDIKVGNITPEQKMYLLAQLTKISSSNLSKVMSLYKPMTDTAANIMLSDDSESKIDGGDYGSDGIQEARAVEQLDMLIAEVSRLVAAKEKE